MATRTKIEQEIKEKYEKRYSARIAELHSKLAEYRETIQQLKLDLRTVTKSRDHYMSELEAVVDDLRQERCYSAGLRAELEGYECSYE